jgi:hypothetical protein
MNSPPRRPHPEICRTRHNFSTYWECLAGHADATHDCPYMLELKLRCYCMHHDRREFERET